MVQYAGRLTQQAEVHNFLGINAKSSIVAGISGETVDIVNWDIDLSGAITRRQGYVLQNAFGGADINHFDSFFKLDGTQIYVVVSGGNLYEATSPAGPWTNRGATFTTGDFTYIGCDINGQYLLCNGVDEPVVFIPGSAAQTLKIASLLSPPNSLVVTPTNGTGVVWQYVITSVTPRGESLPCVPATTMNGPSALTSLAFNTLTWVPVAGASTQNIYRFNAASNSFNFLAAVQGTANTFTDNGVDTPNIYLYAPTTNTAYNTPVDWETGGQPEGAFLLSRGKDQRMLVWRGQYAWISALSNVYDWYTVNDAFAITIMGGQKNNITAVNNLFDYTLIFSETNCFLYTGSTYSDFSLSKITSTGCPSHYGITFVGDQGYVWGQNGPVTIARILSGADVETNAIGEKISPITFGLSNYAQWKKARAWHDLERQRICFAFPSVGSQVNDTILAYNYQVKGWTKFTGWLVENVTYDPVNKINYASLGGVGIVQLHSGVDDSGTAVTNSYTAIYEDFRTYLRKRIVFLDILMDSSVPDYNVTVKVNLDFQSDPTVQQQYKLTFDGTTAYTDGEAITLQGNLVNTHRCVIQGNPRDCQLIFTENTSEAYLNPDPSAVHKPAKIFGFRIDARVTGIR